MARIPLSLAQQDPGAGEPDAADLTTLVMRIARHTRRRTLEALEPFGLSPHQARAFRVVAHERDGELRLSGLADRLRIAPRSATEVVDALEEAGLVTRALSPTDRRAVALTLTTKGRGLAADIDRARAERSDDLFSCLSDAERATLAQLLTRALTQADAADTC